MIEKVFPISPAVAERVDALELDFNHYGFDRFGTDKAELGRVFTALSFFYHHYFKVQIVGLDNVPARGRAMLIGNHSGGLPIDGTVVAGSLMFDKDPPRLAHAMVEKFIHNFPGAAQIFSRTGQFTGNPDQCERLLEDDRLLLVFPEGARGTAKLFREADSLVRFGTGFVRLALRTRSPIVPFGFVGGGEALPTITNLEWLGRVMGIPYVPIPRYMIMLPRPTSLQLIYGEPIVFEGSGSERDSTIDDMVEHVRSRIAGLIEQGRKLRNGDVTEDELNVGG